MRLVKTTGAPSYATIISPEAVILARVIAATTLSWGSQALCAQTDPEMFFSDSLELIAQAKGVCRRCPVQGECLSHALTSREDAGVWGGLDRDERRQLLRHPRSSPSGENT